MSLNKKQIEELKRAIDQRIESLQAEVREGVDRTRNDTYGELAGSAPDTGDEAVADLIADLENAEVDRDVHELREFEAARERIAQGNYGDCPDCGGEIDIARLRVSPAALRCVRCQSMHERTYAHANEPRL